MVSLKSPLDEHRDHCSTVGIAISRVKGMLYQGHRASLLLDPLPGPSAGTPARTSFLLSFRFCKGFRERRKCRRKVNQEVHLPVKELGEGKMGQPD
jgi:hypothetical protein